MSAPTAAATPRGRPLRGRFAALALAIALADQALKAVVVDGFERGVPVEILGDWLRITIVHNTGALFGLFRDTAAVFAVGSAVIAVAIVVAHERAGRNPLLTLAFGLLLGGAVGNLLDRLRYGYVVDFVDMGIGAWRFYTYNVADAAITTSIAILFLVSLFPGVAARFGRGG